MKYNELKPKIQSGDIIAIKGIKPGSRFIRWITRSQYSHVGMAVWMSVGNRQRLMLVESTTFSGRRLINLSHYHFEDFDVFSGIRSWDEMYDFALDPLAEVKYGWLTLIPAGAKDLLLRFGVKVKFPDGLPHNEICSEFIAKCCGLKDTIISPERMVQTAIHNGSKLVGSYRVKDEIGA